jgi:translation elongation factor P/translation initiation factor 5A
MTFFLNSQIVQLIIIKLIDEKIVVVVCIIVSRNDKHDNFIHLKKVFERKRKEKKKKSDNECEKTEHNKLQ